MTDKVFDNDAQGTCEHCQGTGTMELVMTDLSREPWPCPYCDAGMRLEKARDAERLAASPGSPRQQNAF
jgi:excinuclease UvrABC ATPase subunit